MPAAALKTGRSIRGNTIIVPPFASIILFLIGYLTIIPAPFAVIPAPFTIDPNPFTVIPA